MTRLPAPTEYRLLTEHSPVMIWRAGVDSNCDYFNETWLTFTGRTLDQEVGPGWAQGVHPDDLDFCVSFYLDHFRRREAFEMEYRLRRYDGVYRWILDRGVPFTDDSGVFSGFIGSCVDVDERRRAQDAQRQYDQEQLALARDFQKWSLAIVSHDIRNPLNSIQLAARGMNDVSDPVKVKKLADVVTRGVNRIQHLVADLLDLSREREGAGIVAQPEFTDLRLLCEQIIDELQPVARDRAITLDCNIDSTGMWDAHRVMQAISNLTSNAVQHGTTGTPVHLRIAGSEDHVAVEVHNCGIIQDELLPSIFEPFRSVRHNAQRGEGLGLGLFIAKAIARAHGGDLEVSSHDGKTMFCLRLPRRTRRANPEMRVDGKKD